MSERQKQHKFLSLSNLHSINRANAHEMFQIVSLFPREAVFAEHKRQIGQHMKYNTVLGLFPHKPVDFLLLSFCLRFKAQKYLLFTSITQTYFVFCVKAVYLNSKMLFW